MSRLRLIKWAVVASWVMGAILLAVPSSFSKAGASHTDSAPTDTVANQNDYVGSETCQACHEVEFKSFSKTSHSRLAQAHWKSEKVGCESCHGPGKAHVQRGGDKSKIRTL